MERKIKSITAHGMTFNVNKVLYFGEYGDDIDIEFHDEYGKYHRYRTWVDHGTINYEGDE